MNINDTPFSYFGSYMSIVYKKNQDPIKSGLMLKSLRGKSREHMNVLKFIPLKNGIPVEYEFKADYSNIVLNFDGGEISICFDGDSRIIIHGIGENIGLNLDTQPIYNFEYNYLLGKKNEEYCIINSYKNLTKFLVFSPDSMVTLTQNIFMDYEASTNEAANTSFINIQSNNNEFTCIIQDIPTHMTIPSKKDYNFEECHNKSKQAFENFYHSQFMIDEKYKDKLKLAAYINWSSIVKPQGYLKRYTMFASNNYFLGAWSWDHCFNSLALAGVDNQLAYDQMAVLFDYQDEYGQIPGSLSDSTIRWNFTKPPVQGLFFYKMMQRMEFSKEQLMEIYNNIQRQVKFYKKYKDSNEDGICEYHHGNDSGQDNSTVFKDLIIVDSPDLTAFLIKAMDMLSYVAKKLDMDTEEIYWIKEADKLTEKFLDYFIVDDLPVARITSTGEIIDSKSILPLMSIILGKRLPEPIRKKIINLITSEKYLTNWGVATEAIDSKYYQDDAYWRGAIWAPTTLLLVDALEECGEVEIAMNIAEKYCELINKNGFTENFNAISGIGLRDKSFTWTASTFIYLASKLYNYEK